MAHSRGYNPSATDYVNFVGANNITSAYASSAAATQKVAALFGIGYGDRGYGQTAPSLPGVLSGQAVNASPWLNLRNVISTIASYQGTAQTLLPPTSFYASGDPIIAAAPATSSYDIATMISNIDANRLNTNGGASLAATLGALTVTRASTWGASNGSITCEVTATFASEDQARFFFNSGGSLIAILSHPNTTTSGNTTWNTILANLGTIAIGAYSTTRSGSGGTPSALGYYNLSGSYQVVFNGTTLGSSVYSADSVVISALVAGYGGVNGANGTQVKIKIVIGNADSSAYSAADIIALGTNAAFGYKKANVSLTGIASPTYATVTNF